MNHKEFEELAKKYASTEISQSIIGAIYEQEGDFTKTQQRLNEMATGLTEEELELYALLEGDQIPEQRREQAEKERNEEMRKIMENKEAPLRKVSVILSPEATQQQNIKGSEEIEQLLLERGMSGSEIASLNISCSPELAELAHKVAQGGENIRFTNENENERGYRGVDPLNDDEFLQSIARDDVELREGTGVYVGQGPIDICLEKVEKVVSGVNSVLWLPYSILTYPFRAESPAYEKLETEYDFDVVHTNWYGRKLKRKFRLTPQNILRIHPDKMDVRAVHSYSSVESIVKNSAQSIIINYSDESASSPDYITAIEDDITALISIIRIRAEEQGKEVKMIDNTL